MKNFVLVFTFINLFAFNSWSDNSVRINELQQQGQKIADDAEVLAFAQKIVPDGKIADIQISMRVLNMRAT